MGHKKKEKERNPVEDPAVQGPDVPEKKQKKRKRKDQDPEPEQQLPSPVSIDERPKKKRKNRTSFADPRDDKELNGQARKALEYAFIQLNKPSKWKFHKARQNWIIRNVWSPSQVPELYFPIILEYIRKIQGGAKEKLKETSKKYLEPTAASIPLPQETKEAEPKAGPLISVDPAPQAQAIIAPPSNTEEQELAKVQRTRAEQVLHALESEP